MGGNAVGSSVNDTSVSIGVTSENEQVNSSEAQSAQSGKRSSSALIAGESSFGASTTAVIAGRTSMTDLAVFGNSRTYSNAGGETPGLGVSSSASGSASGSAKQVRTGSPGPENASRGVQSAAWKASSGSAGASALRGGESASSMGSKSTAFGSSETGVGVSHSGSAGAGASYPEAFPDSTLAMALLSPPDSPGSPFPGPPDGLNFALPSLNDAHFLRLTLKTGGGRGSGKNPEDAYQRLRDRLNINSSQSSSSPSRGLSTGLSPSPSSSFGSHSSGYGSGLKPSTGLGLGTGLQSTNPYLPRP